MLLPPRRGTEELLLLAEQVGCRLAEWSPDYGRGGPALVGSTAGFAGTLRRWHGRYDPKDKAFVFRNVAELQGALIRVIEDRAAAAGAPPP